MTEKTKAVPGATRKTVKHGRAKPVVTEMKKHNKGVAFLIESELERAEVVLAAKGISTKLQDMAENLSTVEAKDIMPMLDSFRETFGPQAADQFSQVATSTIRELIGSVQTSKSALDNEILRLEKMVNGGDPSDAAMDAEMPPSPMAPPPGAPPSDELPPPPDEAGEGAEGGAPELPPADAGDVALGATGFAGRARKEAARIKGRKLTEENAAEGSDFKGHMDHLAAMSPKCYTLAHAIADTIHDLAVSGDVRNKLTHALGHVVSMASSEEVWDDPEAIADTGVSAHLVDGPLAQIAGTPEVAGIIKQLKRLAHMIAFKHSGDLTEDDYAPTPASRRAAPAPAVPVAPSPLAAGPVMESFARARNIKRLRESNNPDKMILSVFRSVFRECRNVNSAVIGTARAFGIDTMDVVSIIREAKSKIAEDAVPALMGVAMGKPDPNSNPALMSQVPPKPTAAAPQPGQPNKPMSPADMRASAQARTAQDQAAGNQPKQPIAQQPPNVPVQQVPQQQQQPLPSGQQQVQPVQNPQQQQANQQGQKKKPLTMPGKIANSNNVAEARGTKPAAMQKQYGQKK
jgi:hypothetical protein